MIKKKNDIRYSNKQRRSGLLILLLFYFFLTVEFECLLLRQRHRVKLHSDDKKLKKKTQTNDQ